MKNFHKYTCILFSLMVLSSCGKEWLEKKPDISLVVPSSLKDLQALLDNTLQAFNGRSTVLGEIACDDYTVSETAFPNLDLLTRNAYKWLPNIYEGVSSTQDWDAGYVQVYYSNVVLDAIKGINANSTNIEEYNNVKGSALFYSSFAYYHMAQIFCKPYRVNDNGEDLGLPIKASSIVSELPARSNLAVTYNKIIEDTRQAAALLPLTPKYKTRPSKTAAFALLARIYLSMEDYPSAYKYADSALQLYSTLLNFSTLNRNASLPIPIYSSEVIFHSRITGNAAFQSTNNIIDPELYNSYQDNDLRKVIFFKKNASNVPSLFARYSGSSSLLFNGFAVDEMYIIRAEGSARAGNAAAAMNDLNVLLKTRWTGVYVDQTAQDPTEALDIILRERRKELCFRGLRWSDLRRLNHDPRYAKTLTRTIGGQTYTLPPNDNRYVYPIPFSETDRNPNIIQNQR